MQRTSILILGFAVIFTALVLVEPAYAGPGGKIASAVFDSFWGRVLLVVLTIVLAPWIAYVSLREYLAVKRTHKDLRFMAKRSPAFDWLRIMQRTKDCFLRVHRSWEDEDLSNCADWMTDWYWQNQQLVHLNRWKREGLVNICHVKKLTRMRPLLFVHRNFSGEHEESMLVIAIDAYMCDYLQERDRGRIVEGSKQYKEVETVWTLTLQHGAWKVSNIEDAAMSLAYARLAKGLPPIESTLAGALRA